jgi:glutamate transport system permease protein
MTAPVLADTLGPRARRRVLVASVVSLVVIAALVAIGLRRLDANQQLDSDKWRPLTQWSVIKFYLGGLGNTLRAAGTAMAIALTLGAVLALLRLARNWVPRWAATIFVEFFRGLPLYVLIVFAWLGLPRLGFRWPTFWYLVLGLAVYNGAVLAEIFRAGILSLDRGQSEASYALGLSYWQTMGLVVIPQAVRRMIPAVVSQLITLLKDTSLGVLIFYEELLRRARISAEFFQNPVHAIALVAVFYIVTNIVLSQVATRLEARQRRRLGASHMAVVGAEDVALVSGVAADPVS